MKKLLVFTLTACMILCSMLVSVSAASAQYMTVEDAIAAIGLESLQDKVVLDSVEGSDHFDNEGYGNLFDNDVTTKFCTGTFPLYASWKMDKAYSVGGMIVATANDNFSYPGRNPETWILSGSNDGSTWTAIAEGTEYDLEDEDFTYYTITFGTASDAYQYFKFDVPNAFSGCFQMSELILVEAEAPEVVVEEVTETAPAAEVAEASAPATVAVVSAAPQTSDATAMIAVLAIVAFAACVVLKKRVLR